MLTEQEYWSTLRSILSASPSSYGWTELMDLVHDTPSEETASLDLQYVMEHITHWPSALRTGALSHFWPQFPQAEPSSTWGLVRSAWIKDIALIERTPHTSYRPTLDERIVPYLRGLERLHIHSAYASSVQYWLRDPAVTSILCALTLESILLDSVEDPEEAQLGLNSSFKFSDSIEDAWQQIWKTCAALPTMRELNIMYTTLHVDGLRELQKVEGLHTVQKLTCSGCHLSDEALFLLLSTPFECLEYLDVSDNALGDAALKCIVHSPYCSQLKTLKISGNRITSHGAQILADSTQLSALQHVEIRNNLIDFEGFQAFATARNAGVRMSYRASMQFLSGF